MLFDRQDAIGSDQQNHERGMMLALAERVGEEKAIVGHGWVEESDGDLRLCALRAQKSDETGRAKARKSETHRLSAL